MPIWHLDCRREGVPGGQETHWSQGLQHEENYWVVRQGCGEGRQRWTLDRSVITRWIAISRASWNIIRNSTTMRHPCCCLDKVRSTLWSFAYEGKALVSRKDPTKRRAQSLWIYVSAQNTTRNIWSPATTSRSSSWTYTRSTRPSVRNISANQTKILIYKLRRRKQWAGLNPFWSHRPTFSSGKLLNDHVSKNKWINYIRCAKSMIRKIIIRNYNWVY